MIHEKAAANRGTRVDLDAGKPPRQLHDKAGGKFQAEAPQQIRNPIGQHHLKAGIQEHGRQLAASSRVTRADGIQITFQFSEHIRSPLHRSEHLGCAGEISLHRACRLGLWIVLRYKRFSQNHKKSGLTMPEVIINGPEGRIECMYSQGKESGCPVALILHPEPYQGGSMNNKVTYSLYQEFKNRGFSVLRFNFRGVGKSQGSFDNGEGELADAAAVLDWLQSQNLYSKFTFIAGFSFGSWIGMQLMMRRPEISGFICVSPPADKFDFAFLAPCPASGLIVHGRDNNRVPFENIQSIVDRISKHFLNFKVT